MKQNTVLIHEYCNQKSCQKWHYWVQKEFVIQYIFLGLLYTHINICWIIKKVREFQKIIYFCFIDRAKAFDYVDHNKLENSERWEYQTIWPASWEICTKVRKQQLELGMEQDWFQIGKGVHQGCILSLCLVNLYAEYIMRNAGLDEAQARIKIARRNINNLRHEDDTTIMAERELKSLLKMKEESENAGLKLNIQKTKIMASAPTTSWQIDGETMETVADFILGGSKITVDGDCSREIKTLAPWKKSSDQPRQHIKKQRH